MNTERSMNPLLTLITVFSIFIPALLLPGPDFVAVVRSSMSHGVRSGLLTTVGVSIGLCMYATLSLLGLSVILVKYHWLGSLVRVLGGTYLIYLGVRLLLSKPQSIVVGGAGTPSRKRALLFGFLVTLTNPKAIVLFASVFATAVTPSTPIWLMVVMIALVTASSLSWYTCVSLFMSSDAVVKRFQKATHWIERGAGICFVALGGKVLADARYPMSP
jgi:threonine efflux protein